MVVLLRFSAFDVSVSVTLHLMCVHIFSSVWVAEGPPFGKELFTRLTICPLCILTICNVSDFRVGFQGLIRVLIASVPGFCIRFTCFTITFSSFARKEMKAQLKSRST